MINNTQFEPQLSNFLDESFSNATDTVGAVAEGVGALANAAVAFKPDTSKNAVKKEAKALKIAIKAQCGRKRMLLGKKKYAACAKEVADKSQQALVQDKAEERKLKMEQIKASVDSDERKLKQIKASADEVKATQERERTKLEANDKILGMPKSTFFVGLAAIAIGGFLFMRYKNNLKISQTI